MTHARTRTRAPLSVAACYALPDLLEVVGGGMTYQSLERLLLRNGVEFLRNGRSKVIPLSEIERRIPALWRSIVTAEALRQEARIPPVPPVPLKSPSAARGR